MGDRESMEEYIQQRVQKWVHHVEKLTNAAESQPQAAYAALTKSLQFEWTYLKVNDFRYSSVLLPKVRTELYRKSFTFRASQDWNKLPKDVRDLDDPSEFKRKLSYIDF